jgi:hypothetical protein
MLQRGSCGSCGGCAPAAGAADDSNALMGRGVILSLLHRACIVALYSSGVPTATLTGSRSTDLTNSAT